jgi:hypothetical protein
MVTHTLLGRRLESTILAVFLCSAGLVSQQGPAAPNSPAYSPPSLSSSSPGSTDVKEFPVNMKQDVTAGKTTVGTKVQAKLQVATLVDGTVFPKNTVFSGEVTESVAKSDSNPSRIAIRMDSAQWKGGSAPIRIYLTAWIYPLVAAGRGQDLSYGPPQPATKTWNGAGTYPDANSPASRPFPGQDVNRSAEAAPEESPVYTVSKQRVLMKDIESERRSDGAVAITSQRLNIKLDKLTTYVLATGELTKGGARN